MAFDSSGNLYTSNLGNNTIEMFTPGGPASVFATGLNGPIGLAFTHDEAVIPAVVPEPSTWMLFVLGIAAFLALPRLGRHTGGSAPIAA